MTAKRHTERLLKLANILEQFVPHKGKSFDMMHWARHPLDHHPDQEEDFCGTSACALGHAAMDLEFREEGLHICWSMKLCFYEGKIVFEDSAVSIEAGEKFFGLTNQEAIVVFADITATKEETALRLRNLAAQRVELGNAEDGIYTTLLRVRRTR